MANNRKTTKYGSRTVSQGVGGTTSSYSGGSTIKNDRGTRRTTTTKSNGERYIRTTEGSGNGWYKTTQKSLNPRRSKALRKSKESDFSFARTKGGSKSTVVIFLIILFVMWLTEVLA